MKYYIYQHIYKDSSRKNDVQILDEKELAKIGFQQPEVRQRGNSFTIEYEKCTLGVRECKTFEEAKKVLDFIVKETNDIKVYESWEEYKASFNSEQGGKKIE